MSEKEPPKRQELTPGELLLHINPEILESSPEKLDKMVEELFSAKGNNPGTVEQYKKTFEQKDDPEEINRFRIMAFIHQSQYRDICLQFSREQKFRENNFGIHDMGNIMVAYRLLIQDYKLTK